MNPDEAIEKEKRLKKKQEHNAKYERAVNANEEFVNLGYDHDEGVLKDRKTEALLERYMGKRNGEKAETVGIVLGKYNNLDGTLTEESKRNVEKGVELFKSGTVDMLLMSGRWSFSLPSEPAKTEAQGMKEYAVSLGVPEGRVLQEEKSLDTIGNAYYSREMVDAIPGIRRIVLVTIDYHMPRARFLFEKAFGDKYILAFEEAASSLSPELRADEQVREKKTLELMQSFFEQTKGIGDFKTIVLKMHPLYATNPDTVPDFVWKAFKEIGISREDFISKYIQNEKEQG